MTFNPKNHVYFGLVVKKIWLWGIPISKNLSSVNYILQPGVLESIIVFNCYLGTPYSEYLWIISLAENAFLFVYIRFLITGHAIKYNIGSGQTKPFIYRIWENVALRLFQTYSIAVEGSRPKCLEILDFVHWTKWYIWVSFHSVWFSL